MVIVTLALMAVLGAAYIQNAQVQRVATHQSVQTNSNIDHVVESVIAQIRDVLREDLLDDNGHFFNANPADPGGGDEPYDYPSTNPNTTFSPIGIDGQPIPGAQAHGGAHDDMWLASTTLNFMSTAPNPFDVTTGDALAGDADNPVWGHLTNLTGVYLTNGASGKDLSVLTPSTRKTPQEHIVDDTTTPDSIRSDTIIHKTAGGLVDADGDGIGDSRWTWAPIRQSGGVTYVMAVRIIDNSSMLNANVALSQVNDSGNYSSTTNAPRWWNPSELDLGRYVFFHNSAEMTNLGNLLTHRTGGTINLTAEPVPLVTRDAFWYNGPVYDYYQGGTNRLPIQDEMELRYRNGLNSSAEAVIESAGHGLPGTLRHSATVMEKTHTDVMTSLSLTTLQQYSDTNARLGLTTVSGAAILAPPLTATGNPHTDPTLKFDLNGGDNRLTTGDRWNIGPRLYSILDQWSSSPFSFAPPSRFVSTSVAALQEYVDQLTVSIIDYADNDNELTVWYHEVDHDDDPNTDKVVIPTCGMEALPFLSEIYVQAKYEVTSAAETSPGSGVWNVEWERQGNIGYAIEIRNPFRMTISLQNVRLWVDGVDWGLLWDPSIGTSGDGLAGKSTLGPGEVRILFRNSDAGAFAGDDNVQELYDNPAPPALPIDSLLTPASWPTQAWSSASAGNPIRVELRGTNGVTGAALDWPYSDMPSEGMPATISGRTIESSSNPIGTVDYRQIITLGNGNGLNTIAVTYQNCLDDYNNNLANRKKELTTDLTIPSGQTTPAEPTGRYEDDSNNPDPLKNPLDKLGEDNKGGPGGGPTSTLASQQLLISNVGEIRQIGELAHIAIIGPRPPLQSPNPPASHKTVAEMWEWAGETDIEKLMLDFSAAPSNLVASSTGSTDTADNIAVPYAVLMLDQLTTLSPAVDVDSNGNPIDNDNDGSTNASDPDERFVPGKINLNTISGDLNTIIDDPSARDSHLLHHILPIPDKTVRKNVIRAIVKYRDKLTPFNTTNRGLGTGYRDRKGIANLAELFMCVDPASDDSIDILTSGPQTGDTPTLSDGSSNVSIDFLPDPPIADGIEDDREEETMIARWLMQTCSTRSDIYTAYVFIQGYPSGNFAALDDNGDPIGPVESARFIAVFDRSRITGPDDPVRVLGVYRLN